MSCTSTTWIAARSIRSSGSFEAVHLLLAFLLFVCVVAVDPRWIEKCLRERHQHLFAVENGEEESTRRVTVGDYLEKIFQIPIWMSPIESRQRAQVVKSLLGATAAPRPKGPAREQRSDHEGPRTRSTPAHEVESDADGFRAAIHKAEETPDPLRITLDEAAFVDRVAPLLSDKPRALKRFVNVYRLLKASLPDIDRETFVTDGPSSP